jgi:carboxypeptidase D
MISTKPSHAQHLFIVLVAFIVNFRSIEAYRRTWQNRLISIGNNTTTGSTSSISNDGWEGSDESRRRLLLGEERDVKRGVSPEDHLVTSLPLLEDGKFPTRHYAGHIDASSDGDKKLFYWLFEPDLADDASSPPDEEIPLLIWLNGGPGCSSMDGLFLENGPFRIIKPNESYEHYYNSQQQDTSKWRIEINPYSWHKAPAYTLYIDQPVGTGLSFSKKSNWAKDDQEVNIDFYTFLQNFLFLHRDKFVQDSPIYNNNNSNEEGGEGGATPLLYQMKRPLFFSGESHAGHYIPSMVDYILDQNDKLLAGVEKRGNDRNLMSTLPEGNIIVSVQGAAIGNGWVDPYYQYSASKAAYGMGLIDDAQLNSLKQKEIKCQELLKRGSYLNSECFNLLDDIIAQSDGGDRYRVSSYDNRLWELASQPRVFPPGYTVVEAFLGNIKGNPHARSVTPSWDVNSASVLRALHASEATTAGQFYMECTDPPYDALSHQDGKGVVPEVVRILDHTNTGIDGTGRPIRLLFFSGIHDLICNHAANEDFLMNLPWPETKNWITSERFVWRAGDLINNGHPVGYMKQHRNLLFLKVLNAGHMVPMDQPQVSLQMMSTFVYNKSFDDSKQLLPLSLANSDDKTCDCQQQQFDTDLPILDSTVSGKDSPSNPMTSDQNAAASNSVILFAWIAALLAVTALFFYAVMKRRHKNIFILAATVDEEENGHIVNNIEVI